MIIFYNKKTRDVIGRVDGRVHDKHTLKTAFITNDNLDDKDVGKYVVPFKTKYKTIEQPKTELRVVDKKTMRVEKVVVGKEKVKVGAGTIPDVSFADLILDFESGEKNIYDYKVKLRKSEVVGFMLK